MVGLVKGAIGDLKFKGLWIMQIQLSMKNSNHYQRLRLQPITQWKTARKTLCKITWRNVCYNYLGFYGIW